MRFEYDLSADTTTGDAALCDGLATAALFVGHSTSHATSVLPLPPLSPPLPSVLTPLPLLSPPLPHMRSTTARVAA